MCGLWGSIGWQVDRRVTDVIAHRGPDGAGWRDLDTPAGPLSLAHRRLAIIAVDDSGAQPMAYGQGRFVIVFNGEIYNYLELRDELRAKGHRFASESDTEVLLAAYAEWGADCLHRLNGMFAFLLYDSQTRRLFAARDRFGVKPLYLYQDGRGLGFASEIKQFAALPGFSARMNEARVLDFLATGVSDHHAETMFAGVLQVRGGQCLEVDLGTWRPGDAVAPRCWYRLPAADSLRLPAAQAVERYAELLRDSVRLRLRADVPVGSCLSGGLDSSAIVGLVHDLLGGSETARRHAFSCCFDLPGLDERTYVAAVIDRTHAHSHIVTPTPTALAQALDRLVWHQDEPFGSTSLFAQWSVFAMAAEAGVKVMLDGQGADEQLAGYHTMFGAHLAGLLGGLRVGRLLAEMRALKRRHGRSPRSLLAPLLAAGLPPAAFRLLAGRRAHAAEWLGRAWTARPVSRQIFFQGERHGGESPLGALCRRQLLDSSVPMLLRYEDRNSMAHSIEARVPFLDYRLVEFTIALGQDHKIVDGETKHLLREAAAPVLPPQVRHRQDKLGFPTPEERWFKGPLRQTILDIVEATARDFPDHFDAGTLLPWARAMLDGRTPYNFALWRVASFGLWARRFGIAA